MRKLIAWLAVLVFGVNASATPLALAAAVTAPSLTVSPTTLPVGQLTTFTFVAPGSDRAAVSGGAPIAFGDGSSGVIVMAFNDATDSFRGTIAHAYAHAGTYQATVTLQPPPGLLNPGPQKYTAIVTVVAPAPPSPQPTPQPTPRPKPTPIPRPRLTPTPPRSSVPQIAGAQLTWPNGEREITLAPKTAVPYPVALITFSAPGTLVAQWQLDGRPISTVTMHVSPGQTRLEYRNPLPSGGRHLVSLVILQPRAPAFTAPPVPEIEYQTAPAAIAPPSTHGWYRGPRPVVIFPKVIPKFNEGEIDLQSPAYYTSMEGEPVVLLPRPYLDDSTQFTWTERNPGTATSFKFRVLGRDRKTVLADVTLDADTTYYLPDANFLRTVLSRVRHYLKIYAKPGNYTPTNNPTYQLADLYWEVRGYAKSPVSNQQIEVEKSQVWPLYAPQAPDGFAACNSHGNNWQRSAYGQSGNLQIADLDGAPPILSQDRVQLTGRIDTSQSPYAIDASQVQAPPAPPNSLVPPPWSGATLGNVLVDWGDGNITPAAVRPANGNTTDSSVGQRNSNVEMELPGPKDPTALIHPYAYSGQYVIRVFELPQADMQHLDLQALAMQLDAPALAANVPYFAVDPHALADPPVRHASGLSVIGDAINGSTNPAEVAQDAYTLGCLPVNVDTGVDNIAEGPLQLKSVRVTDFGPYSSKSAQHTSLMAAAPPVVGDATTCDVGLGADAALQFYGIGDVKVDWYVDDKLVNEQSPPELPKLSSPRLSNLTRSESGHVTLAQAEVGTASLELGDQSFTHTGRHPVRLSVDAVPIDAGTPGIARDYRMLSRSTAASSRVKIGFLSPLREATARDPEVAYVSGAAAPSGQHVASTDEQAFYQIGQANPKEPCKFIFKTRQGDFTVSGLQGHVTRGSGGRWNGRGVLPLQLQSDGGTQPFAVAVPISGWRTPDNLHVSDGTIDVSPNDFGDYGTGGPGLSVGPVTARLVRLRSTLSGGTPSDMNLTLNAALSDQLLAIAGSARTPSFNNLTAPLDTDGNWISGSVTWPKIELGNSDFFLTADSAVVDLSAKAGAPGGGIASNCGTNDPSFVGIEFTKPRLHVNTFALVGSNDSVPADGWVVTSQGLCGHVGGTNNVGFVANFQDGSVSIPSVTADVSASNLKAVYPDMNAHVPWLDVTLAAAPGDPVTITTTGVSNFSLGYSQPVVKDYGTFRLRAQDLQFVSAKGIGWAVAASSTFDYSNDNAHFATINVPQMYFTLGGRPLFGDGSTSTNVALGGSTTFGPTPLDLGIAHLTAPTNGTDQLATTFDVQSHLSQSLPAAKTQVNYDVHHCSGGFCSDQPTMNPFKTEVAFPAGQPTADAQITPHYIHDGSDDRYEGEVNLGMFGGPPVKAQFLLGYQGSSDYWLFRADVPLSPAGVPIVPGVLNLYQVGGGAGYHIKLDNPSDTADIHHVSFDPSTDLTFIADMQLGSTDGGATYYVDGEFTIFTGKNGGGRLTYKAWLLSHSHDPGSQTLDGFFQYAGGNFDGGMEGQFKASDALYARVPGPNFGGGSVYGISLHVGGGTWYVDVGHKAGPRIQLHLLIVDADGYVMLGSDGLDAGAQMTIDLDIGDDSVASAFARGDVEVEVAVTPQPHIRGDFDANLQVGACVASVCVSDYLGAAVHAEAMPIDLGATATLGMPWPIPDLTVHVHV